MSQILERESDGILETKVDAVYISPYIPPSIIRELQYGRHTDGILLTTY